MTETDVDKAEVLNTFFTNIFTLESLENIPTFDNRLHNTELTDFLITNEEVEKILKTLKTTKPPGPHGLHPRLLVELTDELVEPFQKIFTYIPGWTNHDKTIHEPGQTYSRIWQCSLGSNTQEKTDDDDDDDEQMIENIQRRTTKLVPELKNLEYGDRLRALKLPSLYYRRARGYMFETYTYLHGIYKVDSTPLDLDNNTVTRGHSLKLKKERVTARQRRHYFRHRKVNR